MSEPLLMGIDLGTTVCKAVVASSEGEVLGESSCDYPLFTRGGRVIEQHAQDWWRVVSVAARQAIADSGRSGKDVKALAVSSQGMAFVPLDSSGEVLRPAISWLDSRATDETAAILRSMTPAELFQTTGKRPNAFYSLPKMMWIRDHEPDVFAKTSRFLLPQDYIVYRLTGEFLTDHSLASGTLAHNVSELAWSPKMLAAAEIDESLLPQVAWAGTPAGPILRECAETLGVSHEAVVVCGGQDQKCAALGAGAREGTVTVSLGTATAISAVVGQPRLDPTMRLPCFPFVVPATWSLEGVIPTAGGALKWLKDAFFSGGYHVMDQLAEGAFERTRDLFFYPHLTGAGSPVWDPEMPGALYGISLSTESGDIVRAVLEGVAYQVRSNIETMRKLGVGTDSAKVFGGGARSDTWLQIIADVLGREISVPAYTEASAAGACVLAGVGIGLYPGAEEGAAVFASSEQVVEPDSTRAADYAERYERYREIEGRLRTT